MGLFDMSVHTFDTEIAKRVGLNAAVLYQNIVFWAEHNMRNRRHFHEGRWWTFNSRRAFMEQFDYLTEDQIRHALSKLEKAGLIKKGRFNQKGYDKTTWYSPDVSVDWTLGEKSPMDWGKRPNGSGTVTQPIPDSKPDHKPDTPYRGADAHDNQDFVEGFAGRIPSKQKRRVSNDKHGIGDQIAKAAKMKRSVSGDVF
jgi:hypothetical protein